MPRQRIAICSSFAADIAAKSVAAVALFQAENTSRDLYVCMCIYIYIHIYIYIYIEREKETISTNSGTNIMINNSISNIVCVPS